MKEFVHDMLCLYHLVLVFEINHFRGLQMWGLQLRFSCLYGYLYFLFLLLKSLFSPCFPVFKIKKSLFLFSFSCWWFKIAAWSMLQSLAIHELMVLYVFRSPVDLHSSSWSFISIFTFLMCGSSLFASEFYVLIYWSHCLNDNSHKRYHECLIIDALWRMCLLRFSLIFQDAVKFRKFSKSTGK